MGSSIYFFVFYIFIRIFDSRYYLLYQAHASIFCEKSWFFCRLHCIALEGELLTRIWSTFTNGVDILYSCVTLCISQIFTLLLATCNCYIAQSLYRRIPWYRSNICCLATLTVCAVIGQLEEGAVLFYTLAVNGGLRGVAYSIVRARVWLVEYDDIFNPYC